MLQILGERFSEAQRSKYDNLNINKLYFGTVYTHSVTHSHKKGSSV